MKKVKNFIYSLVVPIIIVPVLYWFGWLYKEWF